MKFHLCCILLVHFLIICDGKLAKSPTGLKDAGVEFVKQAQTSLKSGDLGGFITAVGTVGAYIPGPTGLALLAGFSAVGMAITAISGNKSAPASPFLQKLRGTIVKLDEIAETISAIEKEFSANLKKYQLFATREAIMGLQKYWAKYSQEEYNDIEKRNFIDGCKKERYDLLPRYFSNELTRNDLSSGLAEQYITDMDQKKYLNFAAATLIQFSEAVMLQYNCTVAIFQNHRDLNKTLEFYKQQNGQLWNETQSAMEIARQTFEKNIFDHVKHFVVDYIRQHRWKNAQELHNAIYSKLSNKYGWRKWVLMIRDGPGDNQNTSLRNSTNDAVSPSYYSPLDVAGKTFVLFSPEKNANGAQVCPYIDRCNPDLFYNGCNYIINRMQNCVKKDIITGLGCISDLNGSKVVANATVKYPELVYTKSKCNQTFADVVAPGRAFALKFPVYYVYWIN